MAGATRDQLDGSGGVMQHSALTSHGSPMAPSDRSETDAARRPGDERPASGKRPWRTPAVILPSRIMNSTDKTFTSTVDFHCVVGSVNTVQQGS